MGYQVPMMFPILATHTCVSDDEYSYRDSQAAPRGRLVGVMPFADTSRMLDKMMTKGGAELAQTLARDLIPQLMLLHLIGMAHNDLKPQNVLAQPGGPF